MLDQFDAVSPTDLVEDHLRGTLLAIEPWLEPYVEPFPMCCILPSDAIEVVWLDCRDERLRLELERHDPRPGDTISFIRDGEGELTVQVEKESLLERAANLARARRRMVSVMSNT